MKNCSVLETVKFQTLQDACRVARPNYWCAKVELMAACRSVGIHPGNYGMTGLKWHFQNTSEPTSLFDSR